MNFATLPQIQNPQNYEGNIIPMYPGRDKIIFMNEDDFRTPEEIRMAEGANDLYQSSIVEEPVSEHEANIVRSSKMLTEMSITRVTNISLRQSLQKQLDNARTIADLQRIEEKIIAYSANTAVLEA